MPPKRKRNLPPKYPRNGQFRGETPSNVFQTVDFGAGMGRYVARSAKRFPKRKYAAIDNSYAKKQDSHLADRETADNLRSIGVEVSSKAMKGFVEEMIEKNLKTRHINIDAASDVISYNEFEFLFKNMHRLLVPNGKIYFTSQSRKSLDNICWLARKYHYSFRWLKPLQNENRTHYTQILSARGPIYRLEITYGLKKAISEKKERAAWPRKK